MGAVAQQPIEIPGPSADYLTTLASRLEQGASEVLWGNRPQFLAAALAVHSLPAADRPAWQAKLAGTEGKAAQAWTLLQSLLDGDCGGALVLRDAFALRAHEYAEYADQLDDLRAKRPDLPGTGYLSAAFRLQAVIAAHEDNARLGAALAKLQALPEDCRRALVAGVGKSLDKVAADQAAGKHYDRKSDDVKLAGSAFALTRQLHRAAFNRQVTDPLLAELYTKLPGTVADHLSDAGLLLSAGLKEPAADLARKLIADHGEDVSLLFQAAGLLNGAGHADEVSKLFREGSEQRPYPARRTFRLAYFRQLLRDSYPPGQPSAPGQPAPFDQERQARVAAADTGELEPAFALADARFVFSALDRQTGLAADGYQRVVGEAEEPAMRWSAWLAWAAIDPKAAWAQREKVVADSGIPAGELTDGVLVVTLAAGEAKAAADWLAERTAKPGDDQPARVAMAAALKAGGGDVDGALADLRPWLEESRSRQVMAALRQVAGGGAQLGGANLPAELRGMADAELRKLLAPETLWLLAARFGTEAVGSIKLGQWLTVLWSGVMAMPPGKPTPEQADARDALTAACIEWIRANPKELTAVRGSIQVAASALTKANREFVMPAAESLAVASLRAAKERALRPDDLRYAVSLFWKQLAACQAPAEVLDRVRAVLAECYPDLAPKG